MKSLSDCSPMMYNQEFLQYLLDNEDVHKLNVVIVNKSEIKLNGYVYRMISRKLDAIRFQDIDNKEKIFKIAIRYMKREKDIYKYDQFLVMSLKIDSPVLSYDLAKTIGLRLSYRGVKFDNIK